MRDTWYGDHRDLIKWGMLVHLARREGIRRIVQIAFLREDAKPTLKTDRGDVDIADEVWSHFRNVKLVEKLGQDAKSKLEVEVIDQPFDHKRREAYIQNVSKLLKDHREKKVVLLDPDNGIEPQRAGPEHVKKTEVKEIWSSVRPLGWLVLYQHRRRSVDWLDLTREEFRRACSTEEVETYRAPHIANDVAFFAARRQRL